MMTAVADPGSFRDPSGQVFIENGRVLRTVSAFGAEEFEFVRATGVIDDLIAHRWDPAITKGRPY